MKELAGGAAMGSWRRWHSEEVPLRLCTSACLLGESVRFDGGHARDEQELLTAIDDYRSGMLPLVVPLTLLRFDIVKYEVDYLLGQVYFDPHPKELMLRNHVQAAVRRQSLSSGEGRRHLRRRLPSPEECD